MNIKELIKAQPDGHICWLEGPHKQEPDQYEECRMNLNQREDICIEYKDSEGDWCNWEDSPIGLRTDECMLNAILAAHEVEVKKNCFQTCKFGEHFEKYGDGS